MDKREFYRSVFMDIGEKMFDEKMKKHTSMRVGGKADVFIYPKDVEELKRILALCNENGFEIFIVGEGTNLIVGDRGIRGAVISLKKGFSDIQVVRDEEEVILRVGAGVRMFDLFHTCIERGLSGLEEGAGIPGSVGGALVMNAGTKTWEMKDSVVSITLMDFKGNMYRIDKNEIQFGYRSAKLPFDGIVLDVEISLRRGNKNSIKNTYLKNLEKRKKTQPLSLPSAGSIFKNLEDIEAGRLLDEMGLKGYSIGDAEVSKLHANFIVNKGNARAGDVLNLIEHIEKRVCKEKGIILEREIHTAGE